MQPRWEANVANLIKREPHEMTVDSLTFSIKAMLEELFKVGSEEAARKIVNEIGWMVEMQAEYVACVKDESVTLARALRAMESELREAVADKLLFQDSLVELESALANTHWATDPALFLQLPDSIRELVNKVRDHVQEEFEEADANHLYETTRDNLCDSLMELAGVDWEHRRVFADLAEALIGRDVSYIWGDERLQNALAMVLDELQVR